MNGFRELLRREDGTSVLELALVAPVLAAMLIGIVDVSGAYSKKLQTEQAAQRAIEKVQQYQASSSTFSTMKAEAAAAAGIPVTANNPTVDWWLECDGERQINYSEPCANNKKEARWIEVRIETKYKPFFASTKWPGANADGTYTIGGQAGIRTQ